MPWKTCVMPSFLKLASFTDLTDELGPLSEEWLLKYKLMNHEYLHMIQQPGFLLHSNNPHITYLLTRIEYTLNWVSQCIKPVDKTPEHRTERWTGAGVDQLERDPCWRTWWRTLRRSVFVCVPPTADPETRTWGAGSLFRKWSQEAWMRK